MASQPTSPTHTTRNGATTARCVRGEHRACDGTGWQAQLPQASRRARAGTSPPRPPRRRAWLAACDGTSLVETIGLAAAIAVLLAAAAPVLGTAGGSPLAGEVGAALRQAVTDPAGLAVHRDWSGRQTLRAPAGGVADPGARPLTLPGGPPTHAWRSWAGSSHGAHPVGVTRTGVAWGCVLCAGGSASWQHEVGRQLAGSSPRRTPDRIAADARAHAFLALAAVETSQELVAGRPEQGGRLNLRASGIVGAELDGIAAVAASRQRQLLDLHVLAVAGARARIEQQAAVRFVGIALQQTYAAEAWVGTGVSGRLKLERDGAKIAMQTGIGAALGYGGAVEFSATVDASRLLRDPERALAPVGRIVGQATGVLRRRQATRLPRRRRRRRRARDGPPARPPPGAARRRREPHTRSRTFT